MKYLFLILTILSFTSRQEVELEKIELNQPYKNAIQNSQLYVNYFEVNTILPGRDLLITLQMTTSNNYLSMYISKNTTSPNYLNSELACSGKKVSICSIPEDQIKTNVSYYVAVQCFENCGYQLTIQYVEENFINLGDSSVINSPSQNSLYVLKMYLPPDNKTIDNIVIQIDYLNFYEIQKPVYAYMNKGNVVPKSDSSDFTFLDFLGDKSFTLQRKDNQLEFDSNYTILIDIPENATLVLETQGYKDYRTIYLYQNQEEQIDINSTRTYRLYIQDYYFQNSGYNFNDQILSIYLYSITGDPQIYVDMMKDIQLQDNKFTGTGALVEQINIFPDQRPQDQREFYITIYNPDYYSTYYLWAQLQAKDDNWIMDYDFPIIGKIQKYSIQNFKFYIQNNEDINIYIDLQIPYGNVNLYLKRCSFCNFTQTELDQRLNSNFDDFFRSSTLYGNSQKITFRHDSNQCKIEQSSEYCQYNIGLLGNNVNVIGNASEARYTLNIKLENKVSTLRESDSSLYEVRQGGNNYYVFSIPKFDQNVTRIKFVATCISGDISLVSSRTQMNPTFSNGTFELYGWENYIEYKLEDEKNATNFSNSVFYLGVQGFMDSYYQLTVLVERNNQSSSSQVYLKDDIPQELYFNNENDTIYFTFRVDNQSQPNITIYIYNIYGQFDIYVSTYQTINMQEEHMWESSLSSNNIFIKSNSQSYSKSGIYYGQIVPKKGYSNYKLKIGYKISEGIQTLKYNEAFKDYISSGQIRYFRFKVIKNHTYQITNTILDQNKSQLQTYLATSDSVWPPNITNNKAIIRTGKQYNVTQKMINNSCSDSNTECYFYLAVNSTINTYFTLLVVDNSQKSIQLYDGMVQTVSYPSSQALLNFYFYYDNQANAVIEEFSKFVPMIIYVNIANSSVKQKEWQYPTKTDNILIQSDINATFFGNQRTVQINRGAFPQCDSKCVVLITLAVDSDIDEQLFAGNSFEIAIYQKIKVLTDGNPVQRNIQEGQSDYYLIYVGDDDKVLRISATPMDDNCIPYLSLNLGAYNYETNSSFRYGLQDQGNSIIIFKGQDILYLEGFYTVIVYGQKQGSYQLSYSAGNFTYLYMYQNQVLQFDMKINEVIYIEYYLSSNNSFKILSQKEYGKFYIEATSDKNNMLENNLDNIKYYWSSHDQNNQEYLKINKNDSNYCSYCSYLIKITCVAKPSNFYFMIPIEDSPIYLPDNKVFKDYLNPYESTMYQYNHFQNENEIIGLNINVLKGSIVLMEKLGWDISNSSYDQQFNINKTLQINIPVQASQFMFTIIQILIQTEVESIYTITIYKKRSVRKLAIGYPYFDILSSNEAQVYEFNVKLSQYEDYEYYSVNLIFSNGTMDIPSILIENSKQVQQQCIFFDFYDGQLSCQLYLSQTGIYQITVKNQNLNYVTQYGITVSNSDITYLFPRNEITKGQFEGQNDYYEIIPNNDEERLMIEAYECYGDINIYLGNNLTELQKGHYDQTAGRRNGINHFVYVGDLLQLNQAEYIKVKNSNGVKMMPGIAPFVRYKIKSQLLKKGQYVIYDLISLGNRGDLKLQFNQDDQKLTIQFQGLYCDNCPLYHSQIDITRIQYVLSLDKNIKAVRYSSQCSSYVNQTEKDHNAALQQFIDVQKNPNIAQQPNSYQFEIKKDILPKDFNSLFVNIAAKVSTRRKQQDQQEEEKITFIYNTAEFFVEKQEPEKIVEGGTHKYIIIAIVVGVSLFVVGIGFLIYIWIRMKRAEKILKYENQDTGIQQINTDQKQNIEIQMSQDQSFAQQRYQGFHDDKQ